MASNAEETSSQASVVSAASEQVSKNVQTVATGVEEMNAAIREIAKNASDAARVSQEAVATAATANSTIGKLGESSAGNRQGHQSHYFDRRADQSAGPERNDRSRSCR
jgi:methyl-accepting chemotaxis protein